MGDPPHSGGIHQALVLEGAGGEGESKVIAVDALADRISVVERIREGRLG